MQTAEIVAAALSTGGSLVDVVVREGLREYGVGSLAGTHADEREALGPVFAAWAAGDDDAAIPGGERVGDVVARMAAVLEEVADQHPGEAVLVVGHGGADPGHAPRARREPAGVGVRPHAAERRARRAGGGRRRLAPRPLRRGAGLTAGRAAPVRHTAAMSRVIVVGAGVVGLTCAVRLLEAGHRVDVVARDLPRETTSAVAAALWYPYRALPQDRVTAWSASTYAALAALAAPQELGGSPEAGVRMVRGTELLRERRADPWWRTAVPDLARVPRPAPRVRGRVELPLPRWSRCRSTSTGWPDAWRSSAARSPG